ncbi:hypothetical protein [Stutzerimonas azotifigens]|uniref:Glycosyl transferase n=1 Tax=Stutzerimonas azotifigens TaxID=291995 RepID=A0ABR5Z015_9GAMM|nr:hypothetical protein [Stutzerimonas azotifigens]MBA1273556.1 glycosyl transferase [Stutzerimonas azotifigens]
MKYVVLVVIYNQRLAEGATLRSLERSFPEALREQSSLVVWNNGPSLLEASEIEAFRSASRWKFIKIENRTDNLPLSMVYNRIVQMDAERFVFFDHDTEVGESYWQALENHPSLDVIAPRIWGQQVCHYPKQHKRVVSTEQPLDAEGLITITSGMALSRRLLMELAAEEGEAFDERFALYGVDVSLFVRIQRLARKLPIAAGCYGDLQHSLSELEQESEQVSAFRDLEKFYVAILLRLHYKGISKPKVLRYMVRQLLGKRHRLIRYAPSLLHCLVHGKHPRTLGEWTVVGRSMKRN